MKKKQLILVAKYINIFFLSFSLPVQLLHKLSIYASDENQRLLKVRIHAIK